MAARPWRFNSSPAHHLCPIGAISQTRPMSFPENFLTSEYLFASTAPTNKNLFLTLLAAFAVMVIISILLSYNKRIHPPLRAKLFNFFLTIGILGVLFSFFRYESIPYVGTRLMMLLLLFAAFIWYLIITIYSITKMLKEVKLRKNQQRYAQYLPKARRKKLHR